MALDVLLPLSVELLGEGLVLVKHGFDFILLRVVVRQGRVNLCEIQLGILFLDSLGCVAAPVEEHGIRHRDTSSFDAGLSTTDTRVLGDVRVNVGRRRGHNASSIPLGRALRQNHSSKYRSWSRVTGTSSYAVLIKPMTPRTVL